MPDLRSVFFVIGLMAAAMGLLMFVPMGVDLLYGDRSWQAFAISGLVSCSPLSSAEAEEELGLRVLGKDDLCDPAALAPYLGGKSTLTATGTLA